MGKMTELIKSEKRQRGIPATKIEERLQKDGFVHSREMKCGTAGWQHVFLYTVRACCDTERGVLHIFAGCESDDGGVKSCRRQMPAGILEKDDPDAFMLWLDAQLEDWL